jgi:hypothetical protein
VKWNKNAFFYSTTGETNYFPFSFLFFLTGRRPIPRNSRRQQLFGQPVNARSSSKVQK